MLLARVREKQKRGLAHVHGVIAVGTPNERAWAKVYVEALRAMAPRYGFGFVDGWHKIERKFWPGEQAGVYLSSYFAGGRGRKMAITENVLAGDLPAPGRVRRPGSHLANRLHDAQPAERTPTLGIAAGLTEPPRVTPHEWLMAAAMLERHHRIE